jgi:hypothetical protein
MNISTFVIVKKIILFFIIILNINFLNKYFYKFIIKKNYILKIPEIETSIKQFIYISLNYSMTSGHRMYVLAEAIKKVKYDKIKGDFVECGVWRGGNLILMKFLNDQYKLNRKIYGYDTFNGMTNPSKFDFDHRGLHSGDMLKLSKKKNNIINHYCYATRDDVIQNLKKTCGYHNIKLIKGDVLETLKKKVPKKISILRLDTDYYESTKIELEVLYPLLQSGGVLIIDDYGHWKGCQKAVDEYFGKNTWLHVVDYSCRYIIKK